MDDLLSKMLARRAEITPPVEAPVNDDNPPPPGFEEFAENLRFHWSRYGNTDGGTAKPQRKAAATKPERSVLASLKLWLKKVRGMDVKRVSVGKMRSSQGFTMNFGGVKGESDLILTPHAGQPFERQIHVEVKRPEVRVDGKITQRAGIQSQDQKKYQADMEARGDKYVVVTSVIELKDYLESLGFSGLPSYKPRA